MISTSNLKSVSAAAGYYAEDNYYTQDESTERSMWQGEGAAALGLSGPIEPHTFEAILAGHVGDQDLGRITGRDSETGDLLREHRPGYDVTLSAPKSVSLLAEVDGRSDVRAAHEAAVDAVLDYIEKHLAYARVTVAGQTRLEQTDNIVAARFAHTVSRALDPQTHTHLVIANATMDKEGVWRSFDNSALYRHQKLLGAIYDTELAANLRQLGYRIEPGPKGNWEVAGFSREQVEHFSQRTRAIDERLQGFGLTRESATAAQREDAALRTRPSKPAFDRETLRETWRQRAQTVGIDFQRVEQQRTILERSSVDPSYTAQSAGGAVAFALAHVGEHESVMSRTTLIEVALSHVRQTVPWSLVTLPSVDRAIDSAIASGSALLTPSRDITTAEALEREKAMLALLEQGRGAVVPIASSGILEQAITRYEAAKETASSQPFALTSGQAAAAELVLTSADRFIGLQGYAGVGKTTMLDLVRQLASDQGYKVLGMAPSAEAARTLQDETGIESRTTAAFLMELTTHQRAVATIRTVELTAAVDLAGNDIRTLSVKLPNAPQPNLSGRALWVLDEASLAGQREVTELMRAAERMDARLVLVGDRLQLNAVESGKPFEMLLRHDIAQAEMTQINRQQVQDLRDAVAAAVERNNVLALGILQDRIVVEKDSVRLFETIARDIVAMNPEQRTRTLLIVPLNADRQAINGLVRTELQNQGTIASEEHVAAVLVRSDLTQAKQQSAGYYEAGMTVRFDRAYRELGVMRGDYATVKAIRPLGARVTLETRDGRSMDWDPARHAKVETYVQETRAVAVGDDIRFTRNNTELDIRNGTPGKVTGLEGERMTVSVGGRSIQIDLKNPAHAHWDHAYAMTVHAAQGRTATSTHFLINQASGQAMGERSFYVGITRPRQDLKIYTDSMPRAVRLIQQAQQKSSAMEGVAPRSDVTTGPKQGAGRVRGADLDR
ncbi:MobF family relaxase [Pseudoduganella umbonata]|uniref:Conjugative relaxase n=1 Tax=Pseudoduganella umbonata TaxID=864828 RepID=A0A4P8HLA4_9BURK|nr:MobF family relaxase [Pseudoduganella umbonata]MBB3221720.1 conjugative relaxase-like TrwC/TraI family protein [Pseudoduganella umbonata]QCP09060.1 conjugative relaxase [Pseudoduganella umbonata]